MVGAGALSAAIYKDGAEQSGWQYRLMVFSINSSAGTVSQLFGPEDVVSLAKLARVLALVLADDGCLDDQLRKDLDHLARGLDLALPPNR
jgi:hypothetical protein